MGYAQAEDVLMSGHAHAQGLQSDREFAAVFARSKWRQSRWAPSRIRIVSSPACLLHSWCCHVTSCRNMAHEPAGLFVVEWHKVPA